MNLFFGSTWAVISTLTLIGCILYIVYAIIKRHEITNWKRKIIELGAIGLLLCIFVVMRDDYVLSVQGGQGGQGFFNYDSLQIYLCYFITIIIVLSFLIGVVIKNKRYQQVMFYILSSAIIIKTLVIEISRILMG